MNHLNIQTGIDYSDNHQVIKALVDKQIPENAAEILVGYTQYQVKNDVTRNNFTTKDDLELTKLELHKQIEEIHKQIEEVRREIEVVRKEIVQVSRKTIIWISTVMIANTGILATLIVNLIKAG